MAKRNAEISYNTNLSAEYYVMSLLSRIGKEAYLSLGNKKGVDIIVTTEKGAICLLEVKGVNKQNDWLIGNTGKFLQSPALFYALMCFNGKIEQLTVPPDLWVIPSNRLGRITEHKVAKNEKTVFISNKHIREQYSDYKNTFKHLESHLKAF
jgi:hypothetical protein